MFEDYGFVDFFKEMGYRIKKASTTSNQVYLKGSKGDRLLSVRVYDDYVLLSWNEPICKKWNIHEKLVNMKNVIAENRPYDGKNLHHKFYYDKNVSRYKQELTDIIKDLNVDSNN